jgi:hypothetical protein
MVHSSVMEESIQKLHYRVQEEIRLQKAVGETLGLLAPLFQCSSI